MMGYLISFGLLAFIFLLAFWTTINYKFKADNLGVHISWTQVIGQRLRKTLHDDILQAASLATKENLKIDIIQLEAHKLAGGDPLKVVKEIIDSKHKGVILEYNTARTLDLGGEELRKVWDEMNSK